MEGNRGSVTFVAAHAVEANDHPAITSKPVRFMEILSFV